MLEVVEGAGRLLRGSCLLGRHLIPHLPLYLLLALLTRLNAVEPELMQQFKPMQQLEPVQ